MSPCHQHTQLFLGRLWSYDIDDFAFVHDGDTVGEGAYFVKFGGDKQDRFARVTLLDEATVNKFNGTNINSTRGCAAINVTGSLANSRAMMIFCWLPPESARAGTSIEGVRTSNSLTRRLAQFAIFLSIKTKPRHENWSER